MIERVLLWCVAVPFTISAVALLPVWRPWRGSARSSLLQWWLPIAFAVTYAVSHLGLRENWSIDFPPTNARLWMVLFLPAILIPGLLGSFRKSPLWLIASLSVIAFVGFFYLLLGSRIEHSWNTAAAVAWIGGLALASAAFTVSLRQLAKRIPVRSFIFPLGLYTAIAAGVLGIMGSAQTAMQTGAMATMLGVVFLIAAWKRDTKPLPAMVFPYAFLMLAQISEVYFFAYTEEPVPPTILLFGAPLLMWLGFAPGIRWLAGKQKWLCVATLVVLVAVPTALAGALAYRSNFVLLESEDEYDPYADYQGP